MENKDMQKSIPQELDDALLDVVSGGVARIILRESQTDNNDDTRDDDSFLLGGTMLR